MLNKMKITLVIFLILLGCKEKQPVDDFNNSLKSSLEYLLKNIKLPKEYKDQPLQIISFKSLKIKTPFMVNGKNCINLPEKTNANELLEGMDLFEPLPLFEIIQYKIDKQFIEFDIILRSTGHALKIKLEKNGQNNFRVIKVYESTI